jgi:16S rRNA (cytosine967-C5)-methyltransferase
LAPGADPGLAARRCALALLDAVLRRRRRLDEALAADADLARLSARDRAFARNLTATTLRRLGQIDALLRELVPRMPRDATRDVLRIGACQLAFLRTPAHAAVDTTVQLAKETGFVNAVLRRIAREGDAAIAAQDAARLNTPDWLWQSWTDAYGAETARAIATAHLAEPPLDITVKSDPEGWAARLGGTVLPTGTVRLAAGSGMVTELPGFADGAWWVQDAAAALPARALPAAPGKTIVDLCAAPGGKTAQLAAAGCRVIAVERSARRLALVAETLQRLRLSAELVADDARTWRPAAKADAVLLDAPCTATGTIRRHPDAPWVKRPGDQAEQARAQTALLDAAAEMLAPGGALVYAVCSLQPEEGPLQIEAFLARHREFARDPIDSEFATAAGDIRTLPCHWPQHGGIDGFYVARLRMLSV